MPNFVKIAETTAKIWRFFDFSRWRPLPSWIFKILNFIHMPTSPPWTDMHLIWHSRRGRRRIDLWQSFWWSVERCRFCGGSKIALSHWQSQSPLTQSWRYRAACDGGELAAKRGNEMLLVKTKNDGKTMERHNIATDLSSDNAAQSVLDRKLIVHTRGQTNVYYVSESMSIWLQLQPCHDHHTSQLCLPTSFTYHTLWLLFWQLIGFSAFTTYSL